MRGVAALFVQSSGSYAGLEAVDPWDEARDARLYAGPDPVVAHPPCARWCCLAGLVQARYGYKKGDDGGCFAAALASVRRWGGVLEHPAFSAAWAAHGLNPPPSGGGWVNADFFGGWTCYVEQARYGHLARKATWLYAVRTALPALRWGSSAGGGAAIVGRARAIVGWTGNRRGFGNGTPSATAREADPRPRLGSRAASATPPAFRDLLLEIARSAAPS